MTEVGRIVNKDMREVLDDIERTTVSKLELVSRNVLNQPERVGISSTSSIIPTEITSVVAESGFSSFVINLPRPAISVKNIQLLSANIPQAQVNIQDNALVFYYYRLRTQNVYWQEWTDDGDYQVGNMVSWLGQNYKCIVPNISFMPDGHPDKWERSTNIKYESPNFFNLYCVRLLPSFYKKEMLVNSDDHGYNKTFDNYESLAAELKKACENIDVCLQTYPIDVENTIVFTQNLSQYFPQIAGDISIEYDSDINKFIFSGNNVLNQFEIPEWDINTLYPEQSLIRYTPSGGTEKIYYNYSPERGFAPDNSIILTSWREYPTTSETVWNTYLLAGYNDPNVIKLQGTDKYGVSLDWNPDHLFQVGSWCLWNDEQWLNVYLSRNEEPPKYVYQTSIIYAQGDIVFNSDDQLVYKSLQNNNIGNNPEINPTYWENIYSPWITANQSHSTGINYVSKDYDMVYLGNRGQPFTNTSKILNNQTLNRVLGFSWNGLNMMNLRIIKPFVIKESNLEILLYNRLRPIPQYTDLIVGFGGSLSYDRSITYTADAFCNLVYSSVVNIYTRVLGGSTTDSVRNTNLLAIVPLNCGNLGITFANNFIDNPLTKMDSDIYTLEFSFTTETDQPYWFSNNAVLTLQLKLGY